MRQQQIAGLPELVAVEPQAHQPYPEGEQLIIAVGLAHDGAALGDGLGGHGETEVHVGGGQFGVQGGVEAPPLHRTPVKNRVEVQRVITCPIVMIRFINIPLIPDPFQLSQICCLLCR